MNIKLYAICDSEGRPRDRCVAAGQVSDYVGTCALLSGLTEVKWMLAGRGSDADWFKRTVEGQRYKRLHTGAAAAEDPGQI